MLLSQRIGPNHILFFFAFVVFVFCAIIIVLSYRPRLVLSRSIYGPKSNYTLRTVGSAIFYEGIFRRRRSFSGVLAFFSTLVQKRHHF